MRLQSEGAPDARQRETAVCDKPASRAMVRVLQCVAASGTLSSVLAITASTRASPIVRGAPGRGASSRPSSRCCTNRARHFETVCGATRCWLATILLFKSLAVLTLDTDRSPKGTCVDCKLVQLDDSTFMALVGEVDLDSISARLESVVVRRRELRSCKTKLVARTAATRQPNQGDDASEGAANAQRS
jgi:hypothetical protein